MSAIRFCVLAVVAASLANAMVWSDNCGDAPAQSRMYYSNASITCPAAVTCQTSFCTCIGSTRVGNTTCAAMTSNCTLATMCIGGLTKCLNTASDSTTCTDLADLHMALLGAETAGQWNTSTAFSVCAHRTCVILNQTAGNCSVDANKLCPSPVKFVGTMIFFGGFLGSFNLVDARVNLERDISAFLGFPVKVLRVYTQVPAAGAPAGQSLLVVEFEVEGVNSRNTALNAKLSNLRNSPTLAVLPLFRAQYQAANGDADPVFVGVSGGLGSSAFSGTGIEGGVGRGPSIPAGSGATTTGTPGTGSTAAPTTTGSQSSSSGTTAPGSGAATQSLLAAVVVAVLSAMLF